MRTTPHLAKLDGYQSSNEILDAIETVTGVKFDEDGDEDNEAHKTWASPTATQHAEIIRIAWENADPDEDTLHWGIEKITRK